MTLKNHIGFYIISAMALMFFWAFNKELRDECEWYIPLSASAVLCTIGEAFGWVIYWFFVV